MSRLVPDWSLVRAARLPDEAAVRASSAVWSRLRLLEVADGLAASLAGEGIEPGERVAILLSDDAPAVALVVAARRLGVILVPLNRRAAAVELRGQLEAVAVSVLVHDRTNEALARECASPRLGSHAIGDLLVGRAGAFRAGLRDEVDLDAPAAIVFTSGTSGRPKGAVLTHGNLAASAHAWASVIRPMASDRWLACLPLFHVAGLAMVTRTARWGVELQVAERFDAFEVARALDDGISHLSLVPVQLEQVLAARQDLPAPQSLRAILLGGGPIPTELLQRAREAGYPVLTTYGMTETASGVAVGGADAATLADPTAGRALPKVDLRVAASGAADGSGEILVRGPMVFAGYADTPIVTTDRPRDGWLQTGDVGTIDDDGLLRILDRRDDLLVSGGENVYPAEVEAVLREHPDIADAAVVARPDPRWGAVPVAAIVVAPGATVGDADLERHCRDRLAAYKVPRRFQRTDELPRDALGKLDRQDVSDRLSEALR